MVVERPSRLWQVAKVLLVASLVPLVVAIALLALGVSNPGVQDCGSPAVFVVQGRQNERVALVGEVDADQRARVAQPRCSVRVKDRLVAAGVAGGAFIVLAGLGAVLGLIDDRRRLGHEPSFEDILRETDLPEP